MIGRVLRTGLSSLRDRAANLRRRLAALRFNPSRFQRWIGLGVGFFAVGIAAGLEGYGLAASIWFLATAFCFFRTIYEAAQK